MTATDMWAARTSERENGAWLSAKKGMGNSAHAAYWAGCAWRPTGLGGEWLKALRSWSGAAHRWRRGKLGHGVKRMVWAFGPE